MIFRKEIFKTTLFKVTSLNSLSVVLKIATGLISSKVVALFLGAGGMALVGNMRNFFTSVETISTLGFQNGIIKYVAENQEDEVKLQKNISTIFICLLASSLLLGIVLFILSLFWEEEVLHTSNRYDFVFKILAISLPFYVINVFLIGIINGLGKFKAVVWISIIGNILGLITSVILIYNYHISGALASVAIVPALLFFVSFYFIGSVFDLKKYIRLRYFDFQVIKDLASFSLMAFVYGFIGPMVYLSIRNFVIEEVGLEQAGFWAAMERISANYFLFISTLIGVYFLPKLVLANTHKETQKVFLSYLKSIYPIFVGCLCLIYLLRHFIINLLFTEAFSPVSHLFFWQLLGDAFKAASMILGYQFFAKKMTKAFIATELFSLVILYGSSIYLVKIFQVEGVVIAHAFTYFIYLIMLSIYFRKSLF